MRPQVSQFLRERKKETDPTECTDLHFPDFATPRVLKPRARRGRKKARKKKANKAERYARTHFNRNTRADRTAGHTEELFLKEQGRQHAGRQTLQQPS
jgi:hypothetical protein